MTTLRIGVAGLGRGRPMVDQFNNIPGCEVVAVCDLAEKTFADFNGIATYTSYDDFLREGLDIAAVITPAPVHAEQSIKAMEAGAHVLCETPCVYSFEEADAVVETTKKTGKQFMLAENYIWMGWVVRIKELAMQGLFGEIIYAEGDYTHDCRDLMLMNEDGYIPYAQRHKYPNARKSWRATHFNPICYVSHTLGPLLYIMNDRIISATGISTGTHTAPDLGTIDVESGLFKTEKGGVIRLTNGFTVAHPYALYYNLVGTKGSVKLMKTGANCTFVWYSEEAEPKMGGWQTAPDEWLERPDGENGDEVMLREFVESIQNGMPVPIDVYRSLDFVLPGVAAHQSAMQDGIAVPIGR